MHMLEEPAFWLFVGLVGGALWGLYAMWLGIPRSVAVPFAPIAAMSMVLPAVSVGWNYEDVWTFVPFAVSAGPAVVASFMVTHRREVTAFRTWRCVSALPLLPGVILALLGLRPGSIRYTQAVRSVDQATPVVEQYIREHHQCPEFSTILPMMVDDSLHFACDTTGFGFCIRRFPHEEPVQCWNSASGQWWFERTFMQAHP